MKKDYTEYFEIRERTNGVKFYCVKDGDENQFIVDFVRKIHFDLFGGCLPNDWIYEKIYDAFERLQQCDSDNKYERASCEIEADVYTHDLINWAQFPFAGEIIQEEIDEGLKVESLDGLLSAAQGRAIERIYSYVWEFIQEHRGSHE